MKTYLYINLARSDGYPDNSALRTAAVLNKHGFLLEAACIQQHLPFSSDSPESVLLAQVSAPRNARGILAHVSKELECGPIVFVRILDDPPFPRAWVITAEGASRLIHDD